jgi:Uma2 family endonuclease
MSLMPTKKPIQYPDSDGNRMAENTLQYEWIVAVKGNLDKLFADDPNVFVAGDLLWYPVEGHPEIRTAPDAMVAFGRPKGHRGSYKQWEEAGIAPQVVFEILSPGNRAGEMTRKFKFYEHYGVDEYYIYDPDTNELSGWVRQGSELQEIADPHGHVSPRLGVRLDWGETLVIRFPDGKPFLTFDELYRDFDRAVHERERAEADLKLANWEKAKALVQLEQALAEKAQAEQQAKSQAVELARLRAQLQLPPTP